MTTHNAYDHEAVQHGFVRKCLRFFYTEVDIEEGEYQELENDLPEYAETIINGGGYDLDQRIAALEAENRRLREALQQIAAGQPPETIDAWLNSQQMADIARSALN